MVKVKTLNPASTFAAGDVTFATPCIDLCEPHITVLPIVLNVSLLFKTGCSSYTMLL
jgi:hypothetical protein